MNRAVVMVLGRVSIRGREIDRVQIEPPLREHLVLVDTCSMPMATPPQTGAML